MTKHEKLQIEAAARNAIGQLFKCQPENRKVRFSQHGPKHEFDIYSENIVVGGVSTSPLKTSSGKSNTGGCDRACSELLWLSLWTGSEQRIHVLTDKPLTEWLVRRFQSATFPYPINIYHYTQQTNTLNMVGTLPSTPENKLTEKRTEDLLTILRGSVERYDAPEEPVAENDWEALLC